MVLRRAQIPRRTRRVLGALAALALVAAIDGARTWRLERWNALISAGQVPADATDVPPEVRFAQAHAHAASGADDAALKRYRSLHGDTALGQAARYNSANVLMRQAAIVRAGTEPGKGIALVELAKAMYRDVLRGDPQNWPARYNLERAQRLLPDPEETEDAPTGAPVGAERAATTMRGWTPGLP